jgi:hypothetical protein
MPERKAVLRGLCALALATVLPGSAGATTLIRAGLDELVTRNETVVVGKVVDVVSRWNSDHTFILSDVTFAPSETIKGQAAGAITLTVMGGTVAGRTTLIVAGAELVPGRSYVLFLGREDLPGAAQALTVRDHCQGVFEVTTQRGGLKAVSQAARHPLLPDASGSIAAPGGTEGLPLTTLMQTLRETVRRAAPGGRR